MEWIDRIIRLLQAMTEFGIMVKMVIGIALVVYTTVYIPKASIDAAVTPSLSDDYNQTPKGEKMPELHTVDKHQNNVLAKSQVDKIEEGWAYFTGKLNDKIAVFSQNTNLRSDYPKFPLYQLGSKRSLIHKNTRCDVLAKETVGFGKVWLQVRCPSSSE